MEWRGRDTHFSRSRAAQSEADLIDPQCHRVLAPGAEILHPCMRRSGNALPPATLRPSM